MDFEILAGLFKNLESNPEKTVKVRLISNFIKNISKDSLRETFMLLQSQVFYPWEEYKIGVAEKTVIKAIAIATGYNKDEVEKMFVKTGDMGIVAEYYIKNKRQKFIFSKKLTVKDVYNTFRTIGMLEGEGSQDKKIKYLANLFISASPLEGRYIARLCLEDLKIGVGEGIIIQAIADYFGLQQDKVEIAYSIINDFGLLVQLLIENGKEYIDKIKPMIGTPMKVMLANKVNNVREGFEEVGRPAELEYKYDGFRVQIHKKGNEITLWTRRLENVTKQFPDVIQYAKECLPNDKDYIVEGEIVGYKDGKYLPFQRISQRIRRKYDIEKMAKEIPVEVRLFDIMYYDNDSTINLPFIERRKLLEKIVKQVDGKIKLAENLITSDDNEAQNFFNEAINKGLEGIMFKNLNAKYYPGRRVGYMVKLKPVKESIEAVIVAGEYGEGKRGGMVTSFYIAVRDPDTGKLLQIGQVSSGIKEKKESPDDVTFEDLNKMLKEYIIREEGNIVYYKPAIVIEVLYDGIEKSPRYDSGFALRFPRFIRLRPDRSVEDIDTIDRVEQLYEEQK